MIIDGYAIINPNDDFNACADIICKEYPEEFSICPEISCNSVVACASAGFLPLAARLPTIQGEFSFLTPKLHLTRWFLDPKAIHCTKQTHKLSHNYTLSINNAFDDVAAACVKKHGDGWLVEELVSVFSILHKNRQIMCCSFISAELWNNKGALVAGEFGYVLGAVYTSLSGFYFESGAGNVQLAALGSLLFDSGITIWDLGMFLEYKRRLGAQEVQRPGYLETLRKLYSADQNCILREKSLRLDAADLITSYYHKTERADGLPLSSL